MMIEQKIKDALTQIWGSKSHNVTLILTPDGRLFAECESTLDRRRLTESNYRKILNDMFYDYCTENAGRMGISQSCRGWPAYCGDVAGCP